MTWRSFDRIIAALDQHGSRPRRVGDQQAQALCPSHDDRNASLSVTEGDDGQVLVHCFAGCAVEQVTSALGLAVADLFPTRDVPIRALGERPTGTARRLPADDQIAAWHERLIAHQPLMDELGGLRSWSRDVMVDHSIGWDGERVTIPVRSADGVLVGLLRYLPDPERRNGQDKMLSVSGSRRDLFPAPESVKGDLLFVVEGEADALTLLSTGVPAVAIPGAQGWRADAAVRFRDRHVVLCGDCDGPGRRLVDRAADNLKSTAATVRVLDLDRSRSDGYDVGDLVREAVQFGQDGLRSVRTLLLRMADQAKPVHQVSVSAAQESGALCDIPEYPFDALPEPVRRLVAYGTESGLPPALLAGGALAALAAANRRGG